MRARLAVALAAAVLSGPVWADTKAGVDAWQRGDYQTAVKQWRTAAEAGDADAQFNLGQAYKMGRGVPADYAQAERWYAQAAASGHIQAEDNYGLALFQNGKPRDAIPYLEKSVARGEPRAQYILGTMLFNGSDIKKDWVRAYALTTRAGAAGLPQATQALQQMDTYLSAAEKQQGTALAQTMTAQATDLPGEVAGPGSATALRGVDLPPSTPGRRAGGPVVVTTPIYVPPPAAGVRRTPPAPATNTPVAAGGGRWRLQLGAFGEAGNARKLGGQLGGRFPGRSVDYVRAGSLTKVLVGPFGSRAEAAAACGSVRPCVPVGP